MKGYDLRMQRSITARYASRPAVRFATAAPRAREPLLGLDRHVSFRVALDRPTLLRRPEVGPVALLRDEWRGVIPAHPHHPSAGLAVSRAPVRWANLGVRAAGRRPRAAAAPWRG